VEVEIERFHRANLPSLCAEPPNVPEQMLQTLLDTLCDSVCCVNSRSQKTHYPHAPDRSLSPRISFDHELAYTGAGDRLGGQLFSDRDRDGNSCRNAFDCWPISLQTRGVHVYVHWGLGSKRRITFLGGEGAFWRLRGQYLSDDRIMFSPLIKMSFSHFLMS